MPKNVAIIQEKRDLWTVVGNVIVSECETWLSFKLQENLVSQ
jgi:hypothetical protein